MPTSTDIHDLWAAIGWARKIVGSEWPDDLPITPDRLDALLMEAYEHVFLAGYDLEFGDDALLWSFKILKSDFQWPIGHPAAWFSGLRHANFIAFDFARKAEIAQSKGLTTDADAFALKAQTFCRPMADMLLTDQQVGRLIGRDQIISRWAKALAITSWSVSISKSQRSVTFLDQFAEIARNHMNLPKVIDSAVIIVHYALRNNDKCNNTLERERLLKLAEFLLIRDYSQINGNFDFCGVAGTVAALAHERGKDQLLRNILAILDLFRRAKNRNPHNYKYATEKSITVLRLCAEHLDQHVFTKVTNDLMNALLDLSSSDIIDVVLADLEKLKVVWTVLSEACQLRFIEQAWCIPRKDLDIAGLEQLITALRSVANWSSTAVFYRSWEYAISAGSAAGILWTNISRSGSDTLEFGPKGLIDLTGAVHLLESDSSAYRVASSTPAVNYFKTVVSRVYTNFISIFDDQPAWVPDHQAPIWEVAAWSLLISIAVDDPMSKLHENPEIWAKSLQDLIRKHPPSDRPSALLYIRGLSRLAELIEFLDLKRSKSLKIEASRIEKLWFDAQDVFTMSASLIVLDNHLGNAFVDRWMSSDRLANGAEGARTIAERFSTRSAANCNIFVSFKLCSAYVQQWHAMMFEGQEKFEAEVGKLKTALLLDSSAPEGLVVTLPTFISSGFSVDENSENIDVLTIPEAWQQDEAATLADLLDSKSGQAFGVDFSANTVSVATAQVAWWPNASLYRVQDTNWPEGTALYFARYEDLIVRLDGTSRPIHELNARCPIQLAETTILSYLRFFTSFVHGEKGSFYIIDGYKSPLVQGDWVAVDDPLVMYLRPPTYLGQNILGNFICWGTILYDGDLFHAEFKVSDAGFVSMICDDVIVKNTGLNFLLLLNIN